jgi:hypothetical protein
LFQGRVRLRDLRLERWRIAAALVLYVALLEAHPIVIGVSPLPA